MNVPGCYSSPTIYSSDSANCKACEAFTACTAESIKTLERLRSIVNVEALMKRHMRAAARIAEEKEKKARAEAAATGENDLAKVEASLPKRDQEIIATLANKNTKNLAIALCGRGVMNRIRDSLPRGINPMTSGDTIKWLTPIFDRLIAGPATRGEMRDALIATTGWTEGTAESHVSVCMGLIVAFGLVERIEGKYVIKTKLG